MKKVILISLVILVCGVAQAADNIKTITMAETAITDSWTNNVGRPKMVKLGSAFGTLAGVAADTDTVSVVVSYDSVNYTVDTGTIVSNATTLVIDFDDEAYVGWDGIVTISRGADVTTNEVLNIMLVVE